MGQYNLVQAKDWRDKQTHYLTRADKLEIITTWAMAWTETLTAY